jgi:hypothetical protein
MILVIPAMFFAAGPCYDAVNRIVEVQEPPPVLKSEGSPEESHEKNN